MRLGCHCRGGLAVAQRDGLNSGALLEHTEDQASATKIYDTDHSRVTLN